MLAELGPKLGGQPLPVERLHDAVNVILSYQNHDGGWATYENTRSFHALEVRAAMSICCFCCCGAAAYGSLRHMCMRSIWVCSINCLICMLTAPRVQLVAAPP